MTMLEALSPTRKTATRVPVIYKAVRTLYATGFLNNHTRVWPANYTVFVRKVV